MAILEDFLYFSKKDVIVFSYLSKEVFYSTFPTEKLSFLDVIKTVILPVNLAVLDSKDIFADFSVGSLSDFNLLL